MLFRSTVDTCNEMTDSCDNVPDDSACDNGLYCDGVETCDALLDCQPGVDVDCGDGVSCTIDACDPRTGAVTHESVDLDDGDDCTFDTCNPETGVSHTRPEPKYTCAATCGDGYHVASRRLSPGCPEGVLQSLCQPVCGDSLYTCESSCPPGYSAGTRHVTAHCGPDQPLTFCRKDGR